MARVAPDPDLGRLLRSSRDTSDAPISRSPGRPTRRWKLHRNTINVPPPLLGAKDTAGRCRLAEYVRKRHHRADLSFDYERRSRTYSPITACHRTQLDCGQQRQDTGRCGFVDLEASEGLTVHPMRSALEAATPRAQPSAIDGVRAPAIRRRHEARALAVRLRDARRTVGGVTTLVAVHGVLPEHRYQQDQITEAFAEVCLGGESGRGTSRSCAGCTRTAASMPVISPCRWSGTGNSSISPKPTTNTCGWPPTWPPRPSPAPWRGPAFARKQVDIVFSTTVTGLAVPSIEARIAARVGFRPDVKRVPMFGLGCVAGAAGIARMHDYLLGHPGQVAVLVAVELCSLTVQRDDRSMANLVASGLFGDGAAAVVAVGDQHIRTRTDGPAVHGHPQPPLPGHGTHHGLGHRRGRPDHRARRPGPGPGRAVPGGRCPGPAVRSRSGRRRCRPLGLAPGRPEGDRSDREGTRVCRPTPWR